MKGRSLFFLISKSITMNKDKLLTGNFVAILASNFLLFFAFYLILPILPFYLIDQFGVSKLIVGVVLACYSVASLMMRCFSGYLLDTFRRKPLFLFGFFVFASVFIGYILAATITLFIVLRIIHGLSFGLVSVGGNTIVIDITPSSRRGEAIGYYGLMNNLALSFGPMVGLFMHAHYSYTAIFMCSLISSLLGIISAYFVSTPYKPPVKRAPISMDRFFLKKGIPAGLDLLLLSIPYGITTTYIALYAQEMHISINSGYFFTLMAIGLAGSRFFSGKQADRGHVTQVIKLGLFGAIFTFALLGSARSLMEWDVGVATSLFFFAALMLGVSFGTMFPAYDTLFVNLAPNTRRGTATASYLTSWDLGIGIGLLMGGIIGGIATLDYAYMIGTVLSVISTIYFYVKVGPHYLKNKLR